MTQLPGLFKVRAAYKPTAEIDTFVGEQGELFYSENDPRLRISDGVSPGGIVISSNSLGNVEGLTSDGSSLILTLNEGWDFIPETDSQQSLGSPDKKWKDIYVSGGTIFIGENTRLSENTNTGSLELPAGSTMRSVDGSVVDPIATIDVNSIDWTTVLAGRDLGLDYATTAYVDGAIRRATIEGVEVGGESTFLADLDDIDTEGYNPNEADVLEFDQSKQKWVTRNGTRARVETLETNVTNITNVIDELPLQNLSNVEATAPASGSLLQYNGETETWQATNNIETTFGELRLNGGAY